MSETPGVAATFCLPDVGEGLTEGEVLRWLVAVGDPVAVNQPLVEVETAKAAVELPSPYAGTVTELHAAEGELLPVGAPLVTVARSSTDSSAPQPSVAPPLAEPVGDGASGPVLVGYGVTPSGTQRRRRLAPSPHGGVTPEAGPPGEPVKPVRHGGLEMGREVERRMSDAAEAAPARTKPPVRRLAKQLGVDLQQVRPTGPGGVVTRHDVEATAALLGSAPASSTVTQRSASVGIGDRGRGQTREDVRGVTRQMVQAMTRSAAVPQVTEWLDVDVTRSVELLDRLRRSPAFADLRVTPMLLTCRAVLAALRRTPVVNAVYDEAAGQLVHRGCVNLGVAAATPRGLVVPSIKDADTLGLVELARALGALTETAKAGRATPADLTGGTFSVTNVGVLGVDGGTPLVNPGESAILAVGTWRERPWVSRGQLVVRTVSTLSLTFDHRIIDGATGARFLTDVAALLEEPAADLAW